LGDGEQGQKTRDDRNNKHIGDVSGLDAASCSYHTEDTRQLLEVAIQHLRKAGPAKKTRKIGMTNGEYVAGSAKTDSHSGF